jgi:hypothetical protein
MPAGPHAPHDRNPHAASTGDDENFARHFGVNSRPITRPEVARGVRR